MDLSIQLQLPTDTIERRRLQNRIAQRKFRQKRQHNSVDVVRSEPAFHQGVETIDTPISIDSGFFPSAEAFTFQSNPPHIDNSNPGLEDVNFGEWSLDAMDSIFTSNDISFSTIDAPPFHLDPTSQDMPQSSPAANHTFLNAPITNTNTPRPHPRALISPQPVELANIPPAPTQDNGWLSAIHIAARNGNNLILNILIQQNADLNEKDNDGRTPLVYAVIEGHRSIVTSLLAHGARIDEVDCDNRSALHWAVLHQRQEILKILLERKQEQKLDVNAYDFSGWTPIHMAIYAEFEEGVKMLLECGANITFKARKCPYAEKILPGLLTRRAT
ncbi:Ankyrin repeat domain-containing protein [Lachnellula subtilissima]|uniref:Ankyrin repeat domain-containing protein n=1 Tax=Lachnellula subtilissima TaxID=602034 RepID=A0A8H8U7N6_9HELO|nr:Ankyrin repeat domain-containing protein [Lachnellula subtilissima]